MGTTASGKPDASAISPAWAAPDLDVAPGVLSVKGVVMGYEFVIISSIKETSYSIFKRG